MKELVVIIVIMSLISCSDKEVKLPQVEKTIIEKIEDHSPIYLFFKSEGKDTLIEVNRKNSISSTNWIFNIDKRLPLRLVVPEIIKLQTKKEGSAHKNQTSENYFSYSDSIHKQLAFIPFTKVKFNLEHPKFGVNIYFTKSNNVFVNLIEVKKEDLITYLENFNSDKPLHYNFCFDKKADYGSFIKNMVFIQSLETEMEITEVFIY